MPETTPLIKAALNLRVGAGFDVYTGFFCLAIIKGPPNDNYFIIEGPCLDYFTEKVSQTLPFSKSLLFSRVSKPPSATIFKCFIHKATKYTSIFAP